MPCLNILSITFEYWLIIVMLYINAVPLNLL